MSELSHGSDDGRPAQSWPAAVLKDPSIGAAERDGSSARFERTLNEIALSVKAMGCINWDRGPGSDGLFDAISRTKALGCIAWQTELVAHRKDGHAVMHDNGIAAYRRPISGTAGRQRDSGGSKRSVDGPDG